MTTNKTIEDLAKQVVDSQAGLMSVEDLKVFFEDTPTAAPSPTNQTTVEPANAPAPQAPAVTPAATAEPAVSQPNILDFMPEKFRDADPKTSIEKLTRSYAELEAELMKEREARAESDRMIQNLSSPQPTVDMPPMGPIEGQQNLEDVDDSMFFDKPKEATTKVATQVATAVLVAYHNALSEASKRVQYVNEFKAARPDFNEYREDMAAILKLRPDLDKRVESLPVVYDLAKARYRARLDKMRRDLGVTATSTPTSPVQPTTQPIDESKLIEKVTAAIVAEINKRKAASGFTGATPVSPTDRAAPTVTQTPKTPEDEVFDEMMGSGPKKLSLNL